MEKNSTNRGGGGLTAKRLQPGNFEGVSLAAYRRLLVAAIAAAQEKEVPPHLARVHKLWPAQQEKSLQVLASLMRDGQEEIQKRHFRFNAVRERIGEDILEALLRVTPKGEIRPCREAEGELDPEEQEACHTIYSLYTLAIGTDSKVRKMLAKVLAGTAKRVTRSKPATKARAKTTKPAKRVHAKRRVLKMANA